jgi:hypothetical protein
VFQTQVSALQESHPNIDASKLSQLVSCAHALLSAESEALSLPDFPADSLRSAAKLLVTKILIDLSSALNYFIAGTISQHVRSRSLS